MQVDITCKVTFKKGGSNTIILSDSVIREMAGAVLSIFAEEHGKERKPSRERGNIVICFSVFHHCPLQDVCPGEGSMFVLRASYAFHWPV